MVQEDRERERQEETGYDRVREKLLRQGYLRGGLERFLLRNVPESGGPLRTILRPALKAAILGAPLLGGILATATVAANRPLLDGSDGLRLWGWLALFSAAGLFLLDLAAAGLVAMLAGKRDPVPGDAFRGALMAGLPLLGYLGLLWWRRAPGFGWAGDLAFVAAALGTAALVGWSARSVSLAGLIGKTGKVPMAGGNGLPALALILLPLALVFVLAPRGADSERVGIPADRFEVPAGRPRVVLIGIDGLDGALVERLAPTGAVDHLLRAMENGSVFPIRRSARRVPAEIWTTYMTGAPVSEHKVYGAGEDRLPGVATPLRSVSGPLPLEVALSFLLPVKTSPATGGRRTIRTVWEIAGLEEPVAAVDWWASWPAGKSRAGGYLVTDRAFPKILSGAEGDRDTWPESLFSRLAEDYRKNQREIDAGYRRWFENFPAVGETGRLIHESYLIDRFALGALSTLMSDRSIRSGYGYLPGLDILRDRLPPAAPGEESALERYVAWLDQATGAGLLAGEPVRTILLADPGRSFAAGDEGFLAVSGPGVKQGCLGKVLGPLDVAPLVLRLLRIPASLEMAGSAPDRCLESGTGGEIPRVGSFGRRPVPPGDLTSPSDPELVERLRSLGYIQ